jgi:hypothetical protein
LRVKDNEAQLETKRAAAAAQRPFKLPAELPRVTPDVALHQLGTLVRSKRFEVPTRALEDAKRHVRTLRDLFGRSVEDQDSDPMIILPDIPNLVVAATAGAGKTTLLRYLQQSADTVRYGAELQADTNWVAKGYDTPRFGPGVGALYRDQYVPTLRHVFVGYATFKQGSDTSFDPSIDTEATIQRRCAWRILHDAGLAPDWSASFDIDFHKLAWMLRVTISAAKGCEPDEVAVVFLIDDVTNIPEDPRCVLLDAFADLQEWHVADGRLSFFIVAGLSLSEMAPCWSTAALPLLPLEALPRELAAEVATDAHLDHSRRLELLGSISMAGGHPRTLEHVTQAMKDPQCNVSLPVPRTAAELAWVWDVFADSIIAPSMHYFVDADSLVTEPEHEPLRRLLDLNCLRQHPEKAEEARVWSTIVLTMRPPNKERVLPRIVLTVAPSALFLAEDSVWTQKLRTGAGFPYDAVVAVRALMKATDGIAEKLGLAVAGALHLAAQCVLYARRKQAAPALPGQQQDLRGSVPFEDFVPGAIIGCQCADLRYVVRDAFAHTVDRVLDRADFQKKLRDASCLHSQAPGQAAIESAFAAECGGEAVVVAAQQKFGCDACERQVDEWFNAAAEFVRGHTEGDKFRVLLCVTGLSQEALESIKLRAANKDDRLSRAIIIDSTSASQFFERFGLRTFVEAMKHC